MMRRKRYETKNLKDEENSGDYYSGEEEIFIDSSPV